MSKNQFNNAEENQVKEKKARGKAGTPKGAAAGRSPAAKRQQSQGGNAKKAPAKNTSAKNTPAKQKNSTEAVSEPKRNTYQRKRKAADTTPLRITPLGGLGEIGKNITLYEYGDDMFLVDCGMSFPDEEMPGIDIVIPDFTYVIKNADKIKGLVVTHGHEDHIGAIPYLLKECNFPIYGTALTLGLVEGKLREHKLLDRANLNTIKPGDKVKFGKFTVEFIHVNHSIPDAVAVAVETPVGTVVQTGDFKIDTTPIDGDVIDLARFAELGKKAFWHCFPTLLMRSVRFYAVGKNSRRIFFRTFLKKAENKRIIVATFSSNIHRVQQIIDEAVRCGRKVAVSGRSMINVVQVASELGYLSVPDGVLIDIDMIKRYTPEQLVIITTGSQGEPMSALHRMAFGDHRKGRDRSRDFIIISATPIPGNEKLVTKVVNELLKLGAEVVYEKMYDVHVSGHACQEELKIMLDIVKPKFFIPVHGEQKHLVKHAGLARAVGVPKENILIASIGNVIELTKTRMKVVDTVQAGSVLVDGFGVGDVGNVVLRDRKHLAEDGIIVVAVSVDSATREVISGPEVISRGFVYVRESEQLLDDAKEAACDVLEKCYVTNVRD